MQTTRWLHRLPWASAMLALTVGIATRDCVLVASAALLAIYLARLSLHTREAVDMMRCAVHCWVVGAGSILIANALLLLVLGMRARLWEGNHLDLNLLLSIVGLCTLAVSVTTRKHAERGLDWSRGAMMSFAMLAFAFTARSLDAVGPCLFALGVATTIAGTGWQLARRDGAQLARTATRA